MRRFAAWNSANGSGIVAGYLALFVLVMEKLLIKALEQDVSKVAGQEKGLPLSPLLAFIAREIRNPTGSLGSHAQLPEGDLAELEQQATENSVGRIGMNHGQPHRLERIVEPFLRLWSAQRLVTPSGSSIQTANAQRGSATLTVRLRG